MSNREALIRNIKVGDIFHAEGTNGASLLCLATSISEATIRARRLLVPEEIKFDRVTGLEITSRDAKSPIDSVAPLPADIREVLEKLDYRYNNNPNPTSTSARLTDAEKHALLFIDKHYRENQI